MVVLQTLEEMSKARLEEAGSEGSGAGDKGGKETAKSKGGKKKGKK